jgi:hypothetical protein
MFNCTEEGARKIPVFQLYWYQILTPKKSVARFFTIRFAGSHRTGPPSVVAPLSL